MGQVCCKEVGDESDYERNSQENCTQNNMATVQPSEGTPKKASSSSALIDSLIVEMLQVIGTLIHNDQEPPEPLLRLHDLAEKEGGWIEVICSMIRMIPMRDPLGPLVINLLLDDCPLPSKESISNITATLGLNGHKAMNPNRNVVTERNTCIILSCIAEKLAGPGSITILSQECVDYLVSYLKCKSDPNIILFALIALEKFAQTSENKATIVRRLCKEEVHPLLSLESRINDKDFVWRQVGFCSQWCLDNLFLVDGRNYSYQDINNTNVNVMLNSKDVSQYLKIGPSGLEARCDSHYFESVRCTFSVDSGCWYYETLIITSGVMQIGWATKNSNFLNHDGYGIGDDAYSIAYDGCRNLVWFNAQPQSQYCEPWKSGDILGCLLDLNRYQIVFSINGERLPPCNYVFRTAKSGFFAAASFMSFQQCKFNFGSEPFSFPPDDCSFLTFNDHATLSESEKIILPKHILLAQMKDTVVDEDSCTLCFDERGTIIFDPCGHRGFCFNCSSQLTECPMCRAKIECAREDKNLMTEL